MRAETYYVVKKNKYYGGEILNVGLNTHCNYADMLLYWRDIYDPTSEDEDKYYVVKAGHTNKLTD